MSCDVCSCQIRQKYLVHSSYSVCNNCGYEEKEDSAIGIYVGMVDYFHMFHYDTPHYCKNCGKKQYKFYFPCDDASYFYFDEVEENINRESGDFKNKE